MIIGTSRRALLENLWSSFARPCSPLAKPVDDARIAELSVLVGRIFGGRGVPELQVSMVATPVIHLSVAPWYHYVGDLAAWFAAFLGARWVYGNRRASVVGLARQTAPGYFVCLALGGASGAWLLGSLNTLRDARPVLSHSIAGALAGAIVAVELWKLSRGVRGSTGGPFVIPLALGIIVGRWGCLFAGLDDQTYGIATTLPWGVDLGDGIARHPVQIYESVAMGTFLVIYWRALTDERTWATRHGFHAFVLFYAVQRFAWEFIKPYPKLFGPFNVFHFVMIGLSAYALIWIARGRIRPAVS